MTDIYGNEIQDKNNKFLAGGATLAGAGAGAHILGNDFSKASKSQLEGAQAQAEIKRSSRSALNKEVDRGKNLSSGYQRASKHQRSWFHKLVDHAKSPFSSEPEKRLAKDAKVDRIANNLKNKINGSANKVNALEDTALHAGKSEQEFAEKAAKNATRGRMIKATGKAGLLLGAGAAGYGLYNKMKGQ